VSDLDFVSRANQDYVDALYRRYLRDPATVDEKWALFFAGFDLGGGRNGAAHAPRNGGAAVEPAPAPALRPEPAPAPGAHGYLPGVFDLVHSFRAFGHFAARTNPLIDAPPASPHLDHAIARFREEDLDRTIYGAGGFRGAQDPTLRELIAKLRACYCGTIAVQYLHMPDKRHHVWLEEQIEPTLNRPVISREERIRLLELLIAAEEFELFLQSKYTGHKRFSLEGGESLVPILETVIELSAEDGVRQLIMGMAHRGRLNVLANVLRKPLEVIMAEFEGAIPEGFQGDGDVKYHMGFSRDHETRRGKPIHLALSPNPSHLELVDPVIEGMVRAKQDRLGDRERGQVISLQIHGDAAFTGQGLVPETLSLSELPAYDTGGTIHIVIDNQVGFTESPRDYRFTPYASDVAQMIHAPVFHANGDDPEACYHAARLALGYRQKFRRDAVLNLICYRRRGHNEVDDPTFTLPVLYEKIAAHPTTRRLYEDRLIADGAIDRAAADALAASVRARLEEALATARKHRPKSAVLTLGGAWKGLSRAGADWSAETAVPRGTLERIARACARAPEGFAIHPKVARLARARERAVCEPGGRMDWATAEMLAFGSLLLEGTGVRLAGQDAGRGTFTQRHAAWYDYTSGARYVPLDHLDPKQARFQVIDTMLSEAAVLGFEYGYSWADPWTLTLWEAQFGDFANNAQALIDVFIAAAESKWQRMSGLVLLLPHGYEGQGPEHSSARLERFLQLCADDNMQVVNLTTPAQYFHALRRQMRRSFRKPLVVMSPKSLLRHEAAVSTTEELAAGRFSTVIDDPRPDLDRAQVSRVILCAGKIYYTLAGAREERGRRDVAIVRVEQLYPFPGTEIAAALAACPAARDVVWAQEEPWNMGAWHFVEARLRPLLPPGRTLRYVGREEAASPATGSMKMHQAEEEALQEQAFAV
jgi:2-oxoglutarate dehydrogenase E1 component